MAFSATRSGAPGVKGISNSAFNRLDPAKYTALGDFIDEVNAPDVRANLIKTFGDQGITGFLKLTGAVNTAGTADEVTYWEEARLHQKQAGAVKADAAIDATSFVLDGVVAQGGSSYTEGTSDQLIAREGDIVLVGGVDRFVVTGVSITDGTGVTEITFKSLDGSGLTAALTADDALSLPIVGNMFDQGTDQPGRYMESNVVKRTNPYAIVKEVFKVTGSQATNIGYIDLGGGDYRWYIKGEQDTRQRFMDKREMTLLLGQKTATGGAHSFSGTEGYFAALEDRGLVTNGMIGSTAAPNALDDIDAIITQLDKQGAPSEYALYANTAQMLNIDKMISTAGAGAATTSGVAANYGAFNNDRDMALNLGFSSFSRGGYTFHKHSWKLLNDPTLLDGSSFAGVCIPLANVTDANTGTKAPALEMNYKAASGYSREMEHWVTGGGVLGFNNNGKDVAEFNYRSECNLITRAANQHVLIKSA